MGKKRRIHEDTLMPKENDMKVMLMMALSEMGVTSEQYGEFLKAHKEFTESIENDIMPHSGPVILNVPTGRTKPGGKVPKDAAEKTLVLEVRMKDVTKPPMWRLIEIPGELSFTGLHYAIQAVTGLMNCHLWQFQEHAYNSSYAIGIPRRDEYGYGIDDCTHDADDTPVMAFLAHKDDRIEYVYDFGDDWIFEVKVKDVVERRGEVAECTKWKSDFQPIEDCGGVWSYMAIRDLITNSGKMTKAQRDKAARSIGYDDYEDLEMVVEDNMFDPEYVNECLSEIPDCWEDIDE